MAVFNDSSLDDISLGGHRDSTHTEKQGDREASDCGQFARQFCIAEAQNAKLWCQRIFSRGTSYKEERDPREGSLGLGLLRVLQWF